MILQSIDILNFKNIGGTTLEFSPGVNCLLGMNGMGKSNLLDAIHFLSIGRAMNGLPDSALMKHGENTMLVKGVFKNDSGGEDTVSCGVTEGKSKRLRCNGKDCRKMSEHIGRFPVVSVTPNDSRLVSGSAEERRKLMDMVISQANPLYLASLMRYSRSLESRNRMLRAGVRDKLLYESVENTMAEAAAVVHDIRKNWVAEIAPQIEGVYERLSGRRETVGLAYNSRLNEKSFTELLEERRQKDTVLGYTSAGIHRDDIEVSLDGMSMRNLGSQGQLKTFVIALRLAVFGFLKKARNITPLLLLDDIFDKLDASRVENIMKEVTSNNDFSQIFITDTNRKHLDDIVSVIDGDNALINVENGNFTFINGI